MQNNEKWREKLIADIKSAGLSIAENAENIANKYNCMSDIEVTAFFNPEKATTIEVRQRFYDESCITMS